MSHRTHISVQKNELVVITQDRSGVKRRSEVAARKRPYYTTTRATSGHLGADEQSFMRTTFPSYTAYRMWVLLSEGYRPRVYGGSLFVPFIRVWVLVPRVKISKVSR